MKFPSRWSEAIARNRSSQTLHIPFAPSSALAAVLAIALVVAGCGGSDTTTGGAGGSDNKVLAGTNADLAVGVVTAKTMDSGVNVAYTVLNSTSPVGKKAASQRLHPFAITPVPGLGLFSSTSVSGKVMTISYFTDASGKSSAGQIVVNGSQNIQSTYTYPITFTATGSITGGNVPLNIDPSQPLTITFTSAAGANTMKGGFTLPKDGVTFNLNMSLDAAGKLGSGDTISSTYTYTYLGIPIPVSVTMSGLSGTPNPPTKITGAAAISVMNPLTGTPSQGSGTATLDLGLGTFALSNVTGDLAGLLTSYNISTDNLNVSVGSGFSQTIAGASKFGLGGLLTTSTGGGGGGGATGYQAPAVIKGGKVTIDGALGDGELVGFSMDSSNQPTGYYWTSPTAAPFEMLPPTGGKHTAAHGIAKYSGQTVIVGSYVDNATGFTMPCFWIADAGSGAFKPYKAQGTYPYGGVFQNISANGNTIVGYSYTQGYTQQPIVYMSGTPYSLKTSGFTGNLRAIGVDNQNNVLGFTDGSTVTAGIWKTISVNQTTMTIDAEFKQLPLPAGIAGTPLAFNISDNGVVIGGDYSNAYYWKAAEGFTCHALPLGSNAGDMGYGVNHAGTQFAGLLFTTSPATTSDLAYWATVTGGPVDVTTKLGNTVGSYQNIAGYFVLDDGSLIALASTKGSTSVTFLYIKKA